MSGKSVPTDVVQRPKPQNIQELAQIAGVSTATVSRALAGKGSLSDKTRARIKALATELGFQPSSVARNLRIGRTGAIGVLVPLGHERTQHISDPFFMTLIGYIADCLVERGYDLLLMHVLPNEPMWLNQIVESGRADGIIVVGQSNQAHILDAVAQVYKSMVVWGAQIEGHHYLTVGTDNRLAGRMATEHLLAQGCRKLAFFGDPTVPEVAQRLQGFRDATEAFGKDAVGALLPIHFTRELAVPAISDYLALADSLDGVFAASDTIAMITIQALADKGRSVPGQVKVVGFDNLDLAKHTLPPLTSIQQDLELAARSLVETLFALMEGREAHSTQLEPKLIVRTSTSTL